MMVGAEQLEARARAIAHLKLDDPTSEQIATVRRALASAHATLYRAIAVDVDGTLTEPGSIELDSDVARRLRRFLVAGIPVIVVTGRGNTACEAVLDPILGGLSSASARRLFALARNGTLLLRSTGEPEEGLIHFGPWDDEALREAIEQVVTPARLDENFKTGSGRLAFATAADCTLAFGQLQAEEPKVRAAAGRTEVLAITRATYGDRHTIDIATVTKEEALGRLAHSLGIDPSEILRIGDKGRPDGNDFHMLACEAGFSVGEFGVALDCCHPVLDDHGQPVLAVAGTVQLLGEVLLTPPIRLSKDAVSSRLASLARAQRRTREVGRDQLEKLRRDLQHSIHGMSTGHHSIDTGLAGPPAAELADVFDPRSGAIRIFDDELVEHPIEPDHPAAALFELGALSNPRPFPNTQASMLADSSILLRGPIYYFGKVNEAPERAGDFLNQALVFIQAATTSVFRLAHEPPDILRFKLLLGIADNVRNILLNALHLAFATESLRSESGHDRDDYPLTGSIVELALEHTSAMYRLAFGSVEPWEVEVQRYRDLLSQIEYAATTWPEAELLEGPDHKVFRIRECDSFAENVAAVRAGIRGHLDRFADQHFERILCVGLPNGGIELPLIAAAVGRTIRLGIEPALLRVSVYEDMAAGAKIRRQRARRMHELVEQPFQYFGPSSWTEPVLLLDDNAMTGSSLEWASDLLLAHDIRVNGAIVVRCPPLARRRQMEMEHHGFPDPELLHEFVHGLVATPPYTRLHEGGVIGSGVEYLNALGQFDKSKDRIKQLLQANGTLPLAESPSAAESTEPRWWQPGSRFRTKSQRR